MTVSAAGVARPAVPEQGAAPVGVGALQAAGALPVAAPTLAAVPVGDRTVYWRRRIACVFLIGYAILMFIAFLWSVATSFKALPQSG